MHYPHHSEVLTEPAPEPRDVVWSTVSMPQRERIVRHIAVMGVMTILLLAWNSLSMRFSVFPSLSLTCGVVPVSSIASLLSYKEIKKVAPWLARLLDASPRLAAVVQNSLPSITIIAFNGLLPFLLQCKSCKANYEPRPDVG